jgi:ribosomal protein L7/L12
MTAKRIAGLAMVVAGIAVCFAGTSVALVIGAVLVLAGLAVAAQNEIIAGGDVKIPTALASPETLSSLRSRSPLIAAKFGANDALLSQVLGYIQSGNKIRAIQITRKAMSCDLKEAKDLVDEAGRAGGATPSLDDPLLSEVVRHIRAGNKINAIKCVREARHCSLKQAKEIVEEAARSLR